MRDIYLDYMDVVWISFLDGAVGLIDMDVICVHGVQCGFCNVRWIFTSYSIRNLFQPSNYFSAVHLLYHSPLLLR
jgi:hypothetical protein